MSMIEELKINSADTLFRVTERLVELFQEHKHLRLSVSAGKRSLPQNRLFAARYKELWIQCKFDSFEDARSIC